MRPPGGPPTRGTVLPTSTAVEENGGKQVLVEVRSSLRELTVLHEPQSDHEASARREGPPDETADEAIAQANLGLLYAQRAEGDRSRNWELAIAAFEDALSALTREINPEEWAAAQMHLGVAYRDRLAGDRSENQERAISAIAGALSVCSRECHPEQWTAALMSLGILYWQRVAGHRSEHREQAIAALEDALSVWTRDTNPEG